MRNTFNDNCYHLSEFWKGRVLVISSSNKSLYLVVKGELSIYLVEAANVKFVFLYFINK